MAIKKEIMFNGYGALSPTLFVIHSTANPGATVRNHLSYWKGLVSSGQIAYYTHFITDWSESAQCVETNRLCYHCGNGNSVSIGMEICEATSQAEFDKGWSNAVSAAQDVLKQMGWGVDAMVTHKYMSENYGGSDHTDPIPYFTKWGKTWEDFKSAVAGGASEELPPPVTPDFEGLTNVYTYEAWNREVFGSGWNETSLQYKLAKEAGYNFDGEGFGLIDGYYVVALPVVAGEVGDFFEATLDNGIVLKIVMGDAKSPNDANARTWGHFYPPSSLSMIEFMVDARTWYDGGSGAHANPGTPSCRPEWKCNRVTSLQWVGNFWGKKPTPNPNPSNPSGKPSHTAKNHAVVRAKRYVDGAVRDVLFFGTLQADNYVYCNDDEFYRFKKDEPCQILAKDKHTWTFTNVLTDIEVQELKLDGLLKLLFGAGAWSPPTGGGVDQGFVSGGNGVEDAVQWAIAIAADESHGYTQTNPTRWEGIDYDCGSFVYTAFRTGGGFNLPDAQAEIAAGNAVYTKTFIKYFTACGFEWLPGLGNNAAQLQRGDILLNIENHVEIYIGNNQNVGAHYNEIGGIYGGQLGDQSGNEISVGPWYAYPWDGVLRWAG